MSELHIDMEAFDELADIMEEDFGTLLETYLEDAELKLVQIAEALKAGDAKAVRELAHSFKGASCNVGALPLSRLCEDVEQFARVENLLDVGPLLPGILVEYEEVKKLLSDKI